MIPVRKQRAAILILLTGAILLQLFHLLVLAGIIPYDWVGGGRLKTKQEMYILEGVSIVANGALIFILLIKGRYIRAYLSPRHVHWLLQIFCFFFMLNTLGNLFSASIYERVIFTPLTLVFLS